MKVRSRQPRGYVLLMTIALLVLASTLLVAVGRSAVDHVLLARRDQDELQRRWGIISARSALLPYSEEILSRLEASDNASHPSYRASIHLGDSQYTLIISDEQAKANINALIDDTDKSAVEDEIREVLSGSGLGNSVILRLSPVADDSASSSAQSDSQIGPTRWVTGLGQIFDNIPPEKLTGRDDDTGAAADVTCWGSGAINLMRAREPAMRLALGRELTKLEISRLISARDALTQISRTDRLTVDESTSSSPPKGDADPIHRLLDAATIDPKERSQLQLTAHSTCHSLWIIVQDRQRAWRSLYVADESDPARAQLGSFVW
jgi:Tfp pilus assembly protein PilX